MLAEKLLPGPRVICETFVRVLAWVRKTYRVRSESAAARGYSLLREWLTPEQLVQFEATSTFDVVGCHSGRRYRIHYGTAMNVTEIDAAGDALTGWCFLPSGNLVAGDVMLAQKIALENDEREALSVARRFPVNIPR